LAHRREAWELTVAEQPPSRACKYKVFISYSHAADGQLAAALQYGLHRFAKPWYKLRAMRAFRDKTGLAVTPELWGSIQQALESSEYFILLASPEAAQSKWVEQEVDWWLRNRPTRGLLIVLTGGELAWNRTTADFDWSKTAALPRRLERAFAEEPNYLDLRWAKTRTDLSLRQPKFVEAIASLAATLQGRPLDVLIGEDVNQHRKTMLLLRVTVGGLVLLTIASGFAAFVAWQARSAAGRIAKSGADITQQKLRVEQSKALSAQALIAGETNRDLALLLAMEAAKTQPTPEAESALRQSLFESLQPERTFPGHPGGAWFAAFTPDGKRIITGGADNIARIWDVASGALLIELRGHTNGVTGADFSPDRKRLCTFSHYEEAARGWDLATTNLLFEIRQPRLVAIGFSHDGKYILGVGDQGDAVLYDAVTGQRSHPLASAYAQMRGASFVLTAAFSPDGRRVALVDFGPAVCETSSGKCLFELDGHTNQVRDISYSPDGNWLVTAGEDSTARIWRAATGKSAALLPHDAGVIIATFSPDGKWVATGDDRKVIRIWETASWTKVAQIDIKPRELLSFTFSPNGKCLLTGSMDENSTDVWETATGARIAELTGHSGPIRSPGFSPDGQRIVTASLEGRVNVYVFKLGGGHEELLALAKTRASREMSKAERDSFLPSTPPP
jgi:WD40 repeat protein